MSEVTQDHVLDALRHVIDPDLGRDIVSLGFVTQNAVCDGIVKVTVNLTTPACPIKDKLKAECVERIQAIPGVKEANVEMTAVVKGASGPPRKIAPGVKHVVAVSSGKGGVGKSTVTVNLATALVRAGARVGILDCDVYGPDIPMMMGLSGEPDSANQRLIPKERHGVLTMSIGYLLEDDKPVMWRGPMVHKLIEQFLGDVEWGELDYLLVDMPPGTGDAQLSLAQLVPLSGAVLVTTPQAVSTFDVGKAISMFQQVNVEVLGIVENMSGYTIRGTVEGAGAGQTVNLQTSQGDVSLKTDANGGFETVVHIFGSGGAERLAKKYDFPVIGTVPLDPNVRVGGDAGDPVVLSHPDSVMAKAFTEAAGHFAQRVAIREHSSLPILQ